MTTSRAIQPREEICLKMYTDCFYFRPKTPIHNVTGAEKLINDSPKRILTQMKYLKLYLVNWHFLISRGCLWVLFLWISYLIDFILNIYRSVVIILLESKYQTSYLSARYSEYVAFQVFLKWPLNCLQIFWYK